MAPHFYPICFGRCFSPFTYIGGPKGRNSILQNRTFYFGEPLKFLFFWAAGQWNWLYSQKKIELQRHLKRFKSVCSQFGCSSRQNFIPKSHRDAKSLFQSVDKWSNFITNWFPVQEKLLSSNHTQINIDHQRADEGENLLTKENKENY
jgi:hypothetical protein